MENFDTLDNPDTSDSPQNAGFIFVRHVRACGMCTLGARRFLLANGMTSDEVRDFYQNGMTIEKFEQMFGHDALCREVINKAKEDGQEEKANGWV
ncbi:hypothetical protein ACX1NY_11190 [Acinetobacter sp. ANC 4631]